MNAQIFICVGVLDCSREWLGSGTRQVGKMAGQDSMEVVKLWVLRLWHEVGNSNDCQLKRYFNRKFINTK